MRLALCLSLAWGLSALAQDGGRVDCAREVAALGEVVQRYGNDPLLLAAAMRAVSECAAGVKPAEVKPEPAPSVAPAPAPMEIESFEAAPAAPATAPAIEAFESPASGLSAQVFGDVSALVGVDTGFESPPQVEFAENVWDAQLRAHLGVDVKLSRSMRLFVEGRAWFRAGSQRDGERAKAFAEPMLGEAFLDFYSPSFDLRVGNQRIAIGANAALAPADALNPRDLRTGFGGADPEVSTLPVLAVRARGELGRVEWLAAYVPFFTPSRLVLFGQDEALLQPALAPDFPTRRLDAAVEDHLQGAGLGSTQPTPFLGDLALRAVLKGRVKVGGSWVWINEKLPQVVIDKELSALLAAQSKGKPTDPAAALSVPNRLNAGEQLYRGHYDRQHFFSLEASTLLGPGQLDVDLTWSPRQTFFNEKFEPISKAAVTWVLGYSQATDSPLVWAVSYLGMAVPEVAAQQQIALLEPATAVGADRTAWFHLFAGSVSYPVWHDRFLLELRAAIEPVQLSFTLAPKLTWQQVDRLKVWLALELYEGSPYSPLGYFGRNDQVMLGARYELF